MGKRPPQQDDDMQELQEIRDRLYDQDTVLRDQTETLKQIFWTLKGSVSLGLEGLMPTVDRMEETLKKMDDSMRQVISDVAHLQRWKQRLQSGQISLNVPTAFNTIFRFLGWIIATGLAIYTILHK